MISLYVDLNLTLFNFSPPKKITKGAAERLRNRTKEVVEASGVLTSLVDRTGLNKSRSRHGQLTELLKEVDRYAFPSDLPFSSL